MEQALIPTLVVLTLLQLCRAQSPDAAPEWYAANDINDTNFSPKPITELFSTETSFSPENPIIVLKQSTPSLSNRGVVSSPTPVSLNNESTFPPNVIPLSSTESPPPPQLPDSSQSTPSIPQSQVTQQPTIVSEPSATQEPTKNQSPLPTQAPIPRANENPQTAPPNLLPSLNTLPPQQMQPPNLPFLAPAQMGNRNINPNQQLPPNVGQPNYFVLYQQAPQTFQSMPPIGPQIQQQMAARPPNLVRNRPIVQQSQMPNQFFPQSNSNTRLNVPLSNIAPSLPNNQQSNNQTVFVQQPNNQTIINQQPNNQPFDPINAQLNNQFPLNQPSNSFPLNNQVPSIQIIQSVPNSVPVQSPRLRQKNRSATIRNNVRGRNQMKAPNTPCPGSNKTTVIAAGTKPQNPFVTIVVKGVRPSLQTNPNISTVWPSSVQARRQISQINSKNYDRCLNSCRDRKDRICAAPEKQTEIILESLKGFPSMCHMACHNTFRANPIYEKVTDGRCGKLRTRIQTVDNEKVRRDELKKSQYTIISNVPGTVVELAP